jgi:uncharacterized protein DUF6745
MSTDAWLDHALCTEPADRPAAEAAITRLYAELNAPPPAFVWVGSPAAAAAVVPPSPPLFSDGPRPFETRMATLVSDLRDKLPPGIRGVRRVTEMIRTAVDAPLGLHWRGQHDIGWVARVFEPSPWATLARSCGWWFPRAEICWITERPLVLRTEPGNDGEQRLHAEDGPAVTYPDGFTVHAWHGTRVPSWVIDDPTVARIAAETNVEVRRCAIERIGWGAFVDQAGLRLVGSANDPGNPGARLRLYDLPDAKWGKPARLLLAVNGSIERDGTRRRYGLRVPEWFDDPLDAAGWTYGLTGDQYRQLLRRT